MEFTWTEKEVFDLSTRLCGSFLKYMREAGVTEDQISKIAKNVLADELEWTLGKLR